MKRVILFVFIFLSVILNNTIFANQGIDIIAKDQNFELAKNTNQNYEVKLSIESMKQDVDFIVNWIETHHPEVMKYGFTEEQKSTIKFVYKNIDKKMTGNEFYFIINRLFAMLNDGHCILYYYPKTTLYLDIPFVWLEEGMIITQNVGNYKIGDKIISIGNKSEEDLLSLIRQQISSENIYWLKGKAYGILTSEAYLNSFKLINNKCTVNIKVLRNENKDGKNIDTVLEFNQKLSNKLTTNTNFPLVENSSEWLDWYIEKDNNLGYFRFDSWPMRGEKHEELKKQLDAFFKEVFKNNIRNIAFDVRRNPGGVSATFDDILSYLKTDKIYSSSFIEYPNYIQKKDNLFDGSVYFLTSNQTFSCSVFALTILKDNNIVKTIGEPTGQKPAFNFHGEGSDGMLPNTGWEFMMTSELNTRPMDIEAEDSLYPDIAVYTTKNDILNFTDPQMFRLRQLSNTSLKKNIIKKQIIISKPIKINIKNSDYFNIDLKNKAINIHFKDNEIKKDNISFYLIEKDKRALTYTIASNNQKATINLANTPTKDKNYLLVVNADNDVEYHIEFIIGNNLKHIRSSYTKFGYMLFYFSAPIKDVREYKLIVYNKNNKPLGISTANVVDNGKCLLLTLNSKFNESESYKLYIPKNTMLLEDGNYNTEDIYIDFKIKK